MMVVHEDNERPPAEVPVIRKPLLENKSYVIVKNHVRELEVKSSLQNTTGGKSPPSSENEQKQQKKRKSKLKKTEEVPTSSTKCSSNSSDEIDSNDLEELKSVYTKCKEVMRKIESKYGHLIGLDDEAGPSTKCAKRKLQSDTSEDECHCKLNKKIVFDDEGKQITVDAVLEKHICVKKQRNVNLETKTSRRNIAIEYQDDEIDLPDSLQELGVILHDPNLERTYRNKVLDKIRSIKQEYSNDIKFNKHMLIEKLKSDPDSVLDFKGTNLSSMPGYS